MSSNNRQQSCAERIEDQAKGRIADFADLVMLAQSYGDEITPEIIAAAERQDIDADNETMSEDISERAQERIYELPLAVSMLRVHRIELSTGGPADWLEVFVGEDSVIDRIVYHFSDWFDHAEKQLDGDDFVAAEAFVEALIPEL